MSALAKRELVRHMTSGGLSERRALRVVRMSASALRYQPAPDRNGKLSARISSLVHRHCRYGVGMICLKLPQSGLRVNHKPVERLYRLARLQVRCRKRKKVLIGEWHPLVRPSAVS